MGEQNEACPHLARRSDPHTRYDRPYKGNYCYGVNSPEPVSIEHQLAICTSEAYIFCPVFQAGQNWKGRLPADIREPSASRWSRRTIVLGASGVVLLLFAVVAAFLILRPRKEALPLLPPPGFAYALDVQGAVERVFPGGFPVGVQSDDFIRIGVGTAVKTEYGRVKLVLSDGTIIYLGLESRLGLDRVADSSTGTLLMLAQGRMLIEVKALSSLFVVQVPTGMQAYILAPHSVVGFEYEPESQRFDVDCLKGNCRQKGATSALDLVTCQHSRLFADGDPQGPGLARIEYWLDFMNREFAGETVSFPEVCATLTPLPPGAPSPTPSATPRPPVTIAPTEIPPTFTPLPELLVPYGQDFIWPDRFDRAQHERETQNVRIVAPLSLFMATAVVLLFMLVIVKRWLRRVRRVQAGWLRGMFRVGATMLRVFVGLLGALSLVVLLGRRR